MSDHLCDGNVRKSAGVFHGGIYIDNPADVQSAITYEHTDFGRFTGNISFGRRFLFPVLRPIRFFKI